MYEFSFKSAANASLQKIKEAREKLLNLLKEQIGDRIPENKKGKKKKKEDEVEKLDPFEAERMKDYIDLYNYVKNGFNVVIEVDKLKNEEIKLGHIDKLLKKARALNLPLNLFVSGYSKFGKEKDHVEMLFSKNIMGTFVALNSYLQVNGQPPLRFLEDAYSPESAWSLEQVAKANDEIDTIVTTIKMQNFTPLEAMAYIHYYITSQFPYKENVEDPNTPRSIVGLLNTDNIVCVGYAKFVKSIVDKLNMEGKLSAETIDSILKPIQPKDKVKMVNKMQISGFAHEQNLITIKDDKYYVCGKYINDACWDTKDESFAYGKGFGNFMYTVDDAYEYRGLSYQHVPDDGNIYTATAILQREYVTESFNDEWYKEVSKYSLQIPASTVDAVVYTIFRRTYPALTEEEIMNTVGYYAMTSRLVAAAVFNENASSELSKEGRVLQEEVKKSKVEKQQEDEQQQLDISQIAK